MGYLKAPKINTSARMTSAWASSELLYDTDQNAFYKGDGTTTGGVRLAEGDMASVLAVISALEARVSSLSATPAGVSVTSAELVAAVSAVQSVINIVSNNLSVVNASRISVQNVLSNSISAVSNAVSVVSNALSVETQTRSAQGASINNQISNLKSVVSTLAAPSVTSAEILSTVSIIQTSIAAVSNAVSVVSNALSVESANRVSADNVLSNVISSLNSAHNVLSNQVSQALSLISTMNLSDVVSAGNATSLEIQTSGIKTPHVQFDPTVSAPSTSIYSLTRDPDFYLPNYQFLSALGLKVTLDDVWAVKNQTGSLIPKSTPLRSVGTLGASGRTLVAPMIADGSISPKYLLGVAPIDIPDGADSVVFNKGKIFKLDTSAWPNGTVLYCDPATPGGFTATEPTAPNLKLPIAFVIYSDTTNGTIAVRITEGSRLREDHDVQFTSTISNGDLIAYNSSAQRWENFTPDYATSTQLSAASAQAASAINVVSNALSVETASRVSADAVMSNNISNIVSALNAISAANSVTSAEVAAVLSNAISAVNVVSNAVSVVSNAVSVVSVAAADALSIANVVSQGLSAEIVNRTNADNALSNQISVVSVAAADALSIANAASNAASIVSNNLSVENASRISADNALSNSISNTLSIVNVVSNAVSIVSVGLANEISARAAADTNILSIISVLTDRVSANSGTGGAGSVTSTELSAKLDVSVFNTAGTSVRGLQSVINALSNRISAISGIGGVGSVTSTELAQGLSVVSAQAASAINVVSALIANVSARNTSALSVEGLQSVINALSNRISVVSSNSGGGGTVLSVATISAWQNNYNPSGWGSGVKTVRIASSSFYFITGLTSTADGHRVRFTNVGTFPIGFYDNSSASSAGDLFSFSNQDVILLPNRSLEFEYDGTASVWRLSGQISLWTEPGEWASRVFEDAWFNNSSNIGAPNLGRFVNSGTGSNSSLRASSTTEARPRNGVWTLNTGTASTGYSCWYTNNNQIYTFHDGTDFTGYHVYETSFRSSSELSDATNRYVVFFGFMDSVTGTPADAIMITYSDDINGGNFQLETRNSAVGGSTTLDSGVAYSVDTWYSLKIIVYPNGSAEFFINSVSTGIINTNLPTTRDTGIAANIRKTAGSSSRGIDFDYIGVKTVYNTKR
jgi:hypothetical protein